MHRPGTLYGSLTPYALAADGAPLLLLSRLAAHTKNLTADPRAGLFIGDRSAVEDPQAGARVSLLGRVLPLPAGDVADGRTRYLARWPRGADYFALGDFGCGASNRGGAPDRRLRRDRWLEASAFAVPPEGSAEHDRAAARHQHPPLAGAGARRGSGPGAPARAPLRTRSSTSSRWLTRQTSCSMIGPWSSSLVT